MLAAISTTPMAVNRITVAEFSAMHKEWNELLHASRADCLFLTWEWLHCWWNHLAGGATLGIVTVSCGDLLIAIAPISCRPRSLTRPLPEAGFLGNGFVGSDYPDIIVRIGFEAEAESALTAELGSADVTYKWTNLHSEESFASRIALALGKLGWKSTETNINVCPFISLKGLTWADYLATLGREHRYSVNRKSKRLNQDHVVQCEPATSEEERSEAIETLIALHRRRWQKRGGSNAFESPGLVPFHRDFSALALIRGWLRLFTLKVDGHAGASLYGFLYQRKFYFYQSGFDPDFEAKSVGLVLMGIAIRRAIEEGAEEFDFLHGDESYKKHWAREQRVVSRFELYPPTNAGRAARSVIQLGRQARELIQGMRRTRSVS